MNVANKLYILWTVRMSRYIVDECFDQFSEFNCIEPLDRCIAHLVRLTAKVYIKLIQSAETD